MFVPIGLFWQLQGDRSYFCDCSREMKEYMNPILKYFWYISIDPCLLLKSQISSGSLPELLWTPFVQFMQWQMYTYVEAMFRESSKASHMVRLIDIFTHIAYDYTNIRNPHHSEIFRKVWWYLVCIPKPTILHLRQIRIHPSDCDPGSIFGTTQPMLITLAIRIPGAEIKQK